MNDEQFRQCGSAEEMRLLEELKKCCACASSQREFRQCCWLAARESQRRTLACMR